MIGQVSFTDLHQINPEGNGQCQAKYHICSIERVNTTKIPLYPQNTTKIKENCTKFHKTPQYEFTIDFQLLSLRSCK
jgi:hypothetical protein